MKKQKVAINLLIATFAAPTYAKYKQVFLPHAQAQLQLQQQAQSPKTINVLGAETLISQLKNYVPAHAVIVEVGAFDGNDTKKIAASWPHGEIYAFEAIPENFANLLKNSAPYANVTCFNTLLTTHNGTTELKNVPYAQTPAALDYLNPQEHAAYDQHVVFNTTIKVPTMTLDTWTSQQDIDHIDLLWLDMQGTELEMLKASPTMLRNVRVIYTEVQFVKATPSTHLYDEVKNFIEGQGFVLVAKDFDEQTSAWFGNAIFVRK